MFLEGDVLKGDSFKTIISDNDPLTEMRYKDLKRRIHYLRNYIDEFIILDCDIKNFDLNYLQFLKSRNMGHLDEFIVEINISTDNKKNQKRLSEANCIMYEAALKEKELVKLIGDIFIHRSMPDFNDWENITYDRFGRSHDKFRQAAKNIIADYYNGDLTSSDDQYMFYEANKYLAEGEFAGYDILNMFEIYSNYGLYDKIRELYDYAPSNPRLQAEMGDIEYYGYLGEPDYKKAFEFYYNASECGSVYAKFMLGKLYKNGLGVEKDYAKYEKTIKEIYNLVVKKIDKRLLPCIGDTILELSYIEKEKGNLDKSLKYALQAKKELLDLWKYDGVIPNLTEQEIAEQINNLIGIKTDNNDMLDLFVLLKEPKTILIVLKGKPYYVSSFYDNDRIVVEFNGKYYKSILRFFQQATIKGRRFSTFYEEVYYMEVIK